MFSPAESTPRLFDYERDTFAYANELVWEYRFAPGTGEMTTQKNNPPPEYSHRCFVMARSVRQFFYHARFAHELPPTDVNAYRLLVRQVVARSPRKPSKVNDLVVFPGFSGLYSFSQVHEMLLKEECGGAWQSYALRSHWRMVFPISRQHQTDTAAQLVQSLQERVIPIVHVVRFPQLTINHGIVLFNGLVGENEIRFAAYDPNQPNHPTELVFNRTEQSFSFPRNHYWAGGRLDVIEVYRGWLY